MLVIYASPYMFFFSSIFFMNKSRFKKKLGLGLDRSKNNEGGYSICGGRSG